jgi:hypothetical protein
MPHIKLKKSLKKYNKQFEQGTEIFVSWSGYRELLAKEFCARHKDDPIKAKKIKIDTKK